MVVTIFSIETDLVYGGLECVCTATNGGRVTERVGDIADERFCTMLCCPATVIRSNGRFATPGYTWGGEERECPDRSLILGTTKSPGFGVANVGLSGVATPAPK